MKVRLDLELEFDDGIGKEELLNSMNDIYETIGNNVMDYNVIREEEV